MNIVDFRGIIRQELIDANKSRKERLGIVPDCKKCPKSCKVAMAEGLTLFYCYKSNAVDMEKNRAKNLDIVGK